MIRKVLLVDDDEDEKALFAEALAEISPETECITTSNCVGVLRDLVDQGVQLPDVIFLDINMTPINGWDFLSHFRSLETLDYVPVIIYTTSSHIADHEKAKQLGAIGLYTKASDFDEMKESLINILNQVKEDTIVPVFIKQ